MKFKIVKSSDRHYRDEIEINTLEELLRWCDSIATTFEHSIIIEKELDCYILEIYDAYREY